MTDNTITSDFLPHVVDVLDRVDRQLQESHPTSFVERLHEAATLACEQQGQVVSTDVITKAVADHLAEGTLVVSKDGATQEKGGSDPGAFGWQRPDTEAARQKKMAFLNRWPIRWMRLLHENDDHTKSSSANAIIGIFAGLFSMLYLGIWSGHLIPGPTWLWLSGGLLAGAAGFFGGIIGVGLPTIELSDRHKNLQEAEVNQDMRDAWMANPSARCYVRNCLLSDLPILLKGDLEQIEDLMAEQKNEQETQTRQDEAAAAAKTKSVEQQALRKQFLGEVQNT